MSIAAGMNAAGRDLCAELAHLRFAPPVSHVYNPLAYARVAHEAYVDRYGATNKRVLLVGMNPGPFGMVQTGIPFGEVQMVRTWLGIEARVDRPACEHPRRPIQGFSCRRSEVSGRRLWGAIAAAYGTPERFFRRLFVVNYCPLVFMENSGRNRTPDKLPACEKQGVFAACDRYLRRVVDVYEPQWVIGIGAFARQRAAEALEPLCASERVRVAGIMHPSPANPRAHADWAGEVRRQLAALGICRAQLKSQSVRMV